MFALPFVFPIAIAGFAQMVDPDLDDDDLPGILWDFTLGMGKEDGAWLIYVYLIGPCVTKFLLVGAFLTEEDEDDIDAVYDDEETGLLEQHPDQNSTWNQKLPQPLPPPAPINC